MTAADDNGTGDWAADYNGKVGSGRRTSTALSIRDGEDNVVFDDGGHMVNFWKNLPFSKFDAK
jgi:hypothetical protein